MRNVYIICYDVSDAKRLRQTYKRMQGVGDPMQYSVFRCELSPLELLSLKSSLWDVLNLEEDRVMIVNLGPINGRGDECIEYWGTPRVIPPDHSARIV
jgi:CRISPR-associated protein Cas2